MNLNNENSLEYSSVFDILSTKSNFCEKDNPANILIYAIELEHVTSCGAVGHLRYT